MFIDSVATSVHIGFFQSPPMGVSFALRHCACQPTGEKGLFSGWAVLWRRCVTKHIRLRLFATVLQYPPFPPYPFHKDCNSFIVTIDSGRLVARAIKYTINSMEPLG